MRSIANDSVLKKLIVGILTIIVLILHLCITTYALNTAAVSAPESISLNLNDGKPIFEEQEFFFEPGMIVEKEFFIENCSTCDVYYKLYLDDVKGDLANVIQITISNGNKELYQGTASELSKANVNVTDDILKLGERRDLTVFFYYPENAGNITKNGSLSFTFCAEAV